MKVLKKNGYNLCFTLIVIVLALMPVLLMNGAVKSTTVLFLGKCIAFAIVALGLDLIWGYTGILSLGHGLYFCLGAYGMGMYLKMVQTHGKITDFMQVGGLTELPLIWQFLLLELSIDGLRLAAMNTPTMLSTPLSVIAGIVMGEFSVESGWFNSEVMLYMAFVAVANYTQPNFELGYALKFMRLMLLVLTAVFNLYGFVAGCILVLCFLVFNKTLSGRNYLNVKIN